jgi:DNA-binding transcriptional LysR family regulator
MKLESIDLNLLLVFDALAAERSVTKAAVKIGLSQPALSNALARLRSLFGDHLFERAGGQMQATPRAQQLLPSISEAIANLREALEPPGAFRPEASEREFLVATNDYAEALLLPPLVQRVQRDAPLIAIRTVRTDFLFLPPTERLQSGELDLALGFFGETPGSRPGLLTQRLVSGNLVCILREAHPRAHTKFGLRSFVEIPHVRVMYPENERLGSIDTILRSRGLARRVAVTLPHYLSIPAIVAKSNLLGIVPEWLARREARKLRLRIFDSPIALPDIAIIMTWHERFQCDPAHSWLRERLAAIGHGSKSPNVSSGAARRRPAGATDRRRRRPRHKA